MITSWMRFKDTEIKKTKVRSRKSILQQHSEGLTKIYLQHIFWHKKVQFFPRVSLEQKQIETRSHQKIHHHPNLRWGVPEKRLIFSQTSPVSQLGRPKLVGSTETGRPWWIHGEFMVNWQRKLWFFSIKCWGVLWFQWEISRIQFMEVRKRTICLAIWIVGIFPPINWFLKWPVMICPLTRSNAGCYLFMFHMFHAKRTKTKDRPAKISFVAG